MYCDLLFVLITPASIIILSIFDGIAGWSVVIYIDIPQGRAADSTLRNIKLCF